MEPLDRTARELGKAGVLTRQQLGVALQGAQHTSHFSITLHFDPASTRAPLFYLWERLPRESNF